jgi:GTP 3',8-cyclase / cyclic pyranopterin monophosphate synthase
MVNVGDKAVTKRSATARGFVKVGATISKLIRANQMKKGDVLTIAQLSGIMGAKKTSELIPLCHNIFISSVKVTACLNSATHEVEITAVANTEGKTGVEMEALTAVTIAALTIYDMCKAVSHDIVIRDVTLMAKSGGRTDFKRPGFQDVLEVKAYDKTVVDKRAEVFIPTTD